MQKHLSWLAIVVIVVFTAVGFSQSQGAPAPRPGVPPQSATDITHADIETLQKLTTPNKSDDQLARVVDIGPYNVSMNVQHRIRGKDNQGTMHSKITEIYYVLSGSATLLTGGTIGPDKKPNGYVPGGTSGVGPGFRGTFYPPNLQSRVISAGDVVIIPPNVGHSFSAIEDHIDYLVFRVDPDHVLPTGYMNPALRNK